MSSASGSELVEERNRLFIGGAWTNPSRDEVIEEAHHADAAPAALTMHNAELKARAVAAAARESGVAKRG